MYKSVAQLCSEHPNLMEYISQLEEQLDKHIQFTNSLLNPEEYGYAVSNEVRDQARILKGMKPVESNLAWPKTLDEILNESKIEKNKEKQDQRFKDGIRYFQG
jgi:hypothetical protein